MAKLIETWRLLRRLARNVGPYVLVELLLPGGTLFAVLLYLYRCGAFTALQPAIACLPCEAPRTYFAGRVDPTLRQPSFDPSLQARSNRPSASRASSGA